MNTKIVILKTKLNTLGKSTVYIQYHHQKRTLRISTKEKVKPMDFDVKKQIIKKSDSEYAQKSDSIIAIKSKVDSIIRSARLNSVNPTIEYVSNQFYSSIQFNNQNERNYKSVIELVEEWIVKSKEIKKTKKGTKLKYNTYKAYGTLLHHFKSYSSDRNIELSLMNIDRKFYNDYTNYLLDEYEYYKGIGLDDNSVASSIKLLKIFLEWVEEEGIAVNKDYKEFKVNWKNTDIVVLEWKEVMQLNKFKLTNPRLQKVRDMLIVGCSTGLRISDLLNLKSENIDLDKREICITTIKTEHKITVPILDIALSLLKRYIKKEGVKLFSISSQKFNDYLKELGKMAGITKVVSKTKYKNGRRLDYTVPKYELLTSHICRRTYITELLKRKVPAEVIMQATGHRDYKSFKKYVKLANEDVKIQIQQVFS